MKPELEKLMKVLSSHGTDEMILATSIAFWAARRFLWQNPEPFREKFGTLGEEIMNKYGE